MGKSDALGLLVQDHVAICELLQQTRTASSAQRRVLVPRLQELTRRHLEAEQWLLSQVGEGQGDGEAVRDAAAALQRRLDGRSFEVGMGRFMDELAAHAEHQEHRLFPLLRRKFTTRQLRRLGGDMVRIRAGPGLTIE